MRLQRIALDPVPHAEGAAGRMRAVSADRKSASEVTDPSGFLLTIYSETPA
ncbi:MAG TPA: hypothetical protein VJ813_14790 [Vicinamibacterales bacterium]|nr:hypothetical protein [Vicinamibacterales bacterium]